MYFSVVGSTNSIFLLDMLKTPTKFFSPEKASCLLLGEEAGPVEDANVGGNGADMLVFGVLMLTV
jgi:hypothetical protein